ncbi:MAG TPA: tetratricopeptide repeat protein [Ignavibacteriales bacterium]|nr:tetratricopeptide repeat protein [Ignavibacteriales bacterium]
MLKRILPKGRKGRSRISKIIYFILIFLLSFNVIASAVDVDKIMSSANKLYREGTYDKAIDEYRKLIDDGYEGVSLYYNLGNSYYRLGKIGYAILYYEKALKLSPSDEDVKHNIAFAQLSTVDRIQPLPKFFLFEWWESLLNLFSVNGWAYVAYCFYILLLIVIGSYFFARYVKQQKTIFLAGIITLLLFSFSVSILIVKINRAEHLKEGVIVAQVVTVKSSPDPKSTDAFVIHEGLKVKLDDKLDNWVKIRLADGKVGWIENTYVEQI